MKKFYTVKFVTKKGGWQDWIIHIEANTAKEAKELAKERFERIYGMHQFHIEATRLPDTEEFLYHTFCQMSEKTIKEYEEAKEARKAAKEAKKSAKAAQEEQAAQITETAPEESARKLSDYESAKAVIKANIEDAHNIEDELEKFDDSPITLVEFSEDHMELWTAEGDLLANLEAYGMGMYLVTKKDIFGIDEETTIHKTLEDAKAYLEAYRDEMMATMKPDAEADPEKADDTISDSLRKYQKGKAEYQELVDIALEQYRDFKAVQEIDCDEFDSLAEYKAAVSEASSLMWKKVEAGVNASRTSPKGFLYRMIYNQIQMGNEELDIHTEEGLDCDLIDDDARNLVEMLTSGYSITHITVSGYHAMELANKIIHMGGVLSGMTEINALGHRYQIPALRMMLPNP